MSTRSSDYTTYFVDLLEQHQDALELKGVSYGDQERIPFTPFACVEPGRITREYNGTSRRVIVMIPTHIITYHAKVQSVEDNLKTVDDLTDAIMRLVHADNQLGGLCIDSLVNEITPGYQRRGNTLFRATMLTVEARQQEILPATL